MVNTEILRVSLCDKQLGPLCSIYIPTCSIVFGERKAMCGPRWTGQTIGRVTGLILAPAGEPAIKLVVVADDVAGHCDP